MLTAIARVAGVFAVLAAAAAWVLAVVFAPVWAAWAVTLALVAGGVAWVRIERRASARRLEELREHVRQEGLG